MNGSLWQGKKGVNIMGMDMSTGKIRGLSSKDELKETEVLFEVGEEVEVKGCRFKVIGVYPDPANEITLKGQARGIADILGEPLKFEG